LWCECVTIAVPFVFYSRNNVSLETPITVPFVFYSRNNVSLETPITVPFVFYSRNNVSLETPAWLCRTLYGAHQPFVFCIIYHTWIRLL